MSLVKLASTLSGIASVGKHLATNPLTRNAAIGVAGGAALGAATGEKGHKLSGALIGGLTGGTLGAAGTLAAQGHHAAKSTKSSLKEGIGHAVDYNKKVLSSLGTVYKLNK